MRHLLAFSLCFASTILSNGDEPDAGSEPVADSTNTQSSVAFPRVDEVTKGEDTIVWSPRLQIILNTNSNLHLTKLVKKQVQVSTPFESGSQGDRSIVIEERVLAVSLTEIATMYCDSMTLNVLEEGDTSSYSLECKSRVNIRLSGIVIDADSASLKHEKCELVNATLTHGKMTATAPQLTLSLPIHGVLTNPFGRPVPETPPAVNLSNPPDPIGGVLRPVPDPIGGGA